MRKISKVAKVMTMGLLVLGLGGATAFAAGQNNTGNCAGTTDSKSKGDQTTTTDQAPETQGTKAAKGKS